MKKIICFLIAIILSFSVTACKKINTEDQNSSGEVSKPQLGTVEIIENENIVSSQLQSTTNTDTATSSKPDASSSKEETSSQDTTSSPTIIKPIKPYSGNLPSISVGKIPQFKSKKFDISGFWAPYEISEESFTTYKNAGFTTLAMINHSLGNNSENQFYLGSDRTLKALEICRKVGLNAILNYNDWKAKQCEGRAYYGATPFSKFDVYGEYKDIITGVHIVDEPYKQHPSNGERHFEIYGDKTLIEDFKKVYPNADYVVNLIPYTAFLSRGFDSYDEMMDMYEKTFMEPFGNKSYVSVDVYPFHEGSGFDDGTLALNYEYIANSAKKYGVKPAYILQSSVGGGEFEQKLSEDDLRWEINAALCFGADTLQYYCYSVPKSFLADGSEANMYDYCILNRDNTPSPIYYSLQKLHKEIQSYSDVILAYNWNESIGILGSGDFAGRVSNLAYDKDFNTRYFKNPKHCVDITTTQELIASHFTNTQYGEAYMFVNFADRAANTVTATFRDCKAIAVYGGKGYTDIPKIVELDKNGNVTINLGYGDGVFVIPLV